MLTVTLWAHGVYCVGGIWSPSWHWIAFGNPVDTCCDVVPVTCGWYPLLVDVELASTFGLYLVIDMYMYGHKDDTFYD